MQDFISKLGIDWHLLAAQAVNFFVLLVVLRIFAYKPILAILKERRKKIEEGLTKAEAADTRLKEANAVAASKVKEAEVNALSILRATEERAKRREADMLAEAEKKEATYLKNAELRAKAKEEEAEAELRKEAALLVRQAITKTVSLAPEAIDEALINKAVQDIHIGS